MKHNIDRRRGEEDVSEGGKKSMEVARKMKSFSVIVTDRKILKG
jgi:hypothetical protein